VRAKELMQRIKSNNPLTVVDVRSKLEFRAGHVPGAIHVPMWKILFRLAKLPEDKSAEFVLTCEHGPRAQMAQKLLGQRGYRNLVLLDGHMAAWRRSGLKIEK